MRINGLDHVNILTEDLDRSARFYADLFGLRDGDPPRPLDPAKARWMYDDGGRAIIHLNTGMAGEQARAAIGGPTGAIDHVALDCSGSDAMLARIDRMGVARRVVELTEAGIRQIFVHDPSNVRLELNFRGEAAG